MKISCLGYIHSGIEKEKMRLRVAEAENENPDNYMIADEHEFPGAYLGPNFIRAEDVSKRVAEFLKLPILPLPNAKANSKTYVRERKQRKFKRESKAKEYNS